MGIGRRRWRVYGVRPILTRVQQPERSCSNYLLINGIVACVELLFFICKVVAVVMLCAIHRASIVYALSTLPPVPPF